MKTVTHHYTASISEGPDWEYKTACGLKVHWKRGDEWDTWHYSFNITKMAKIANLRNNKLGYTARVCQTCLDRHSLLELAHTKL